MLNYNTENFGTKNIHFASCSRFISAPRYAYLLVSTLEMLITDIVGNFERVAGVLVWGWLAWFAFVVIFQWNTFGNLARSPALVAPGTVSRCVEDSPTHQIIVEVFCPKMCIHFFVAFQIACFGFQDGFWRYGFFCPKTRRRRETSCTNKCLFKLRIPDPKRWLP